MTTFDPPELKARIVGAFKVLGEFLTIKWDALDDEFNPSAKSDLVVTEQSVVESVHLVGPDSAFDRPVSELLTWADGLTAGKLIARKEFRSQS